MTKKYSAEIPQIIVNTAPRVTLNYGAYEVSEEELLALWKEQYVEMDDMPQEPDEWFRTEHKYAYYELLIPMGHWNYGGVVNYIVRDKYSQSDMEAITNNMAAVNAMFMQVLVADGIIAATKYLKDSIDEDDSKRFREMQEWRAYAKEIARQVTKS